MVNQTDSKIFNEMKHRVLLQSAITSADAGGGFNVTWCDAAIVWAKIETLSARQARYEALYQEQLQSRKLIIITIRHRENISEKMRVKYGARIFNIRSVTDPDEAGIWLELVVEENAAD